MKERPILFSTPMVKAILAGTKTQTRRIIKLPRAPDHRGGWAATTFGGHGVTDSRGKPVAEHPGIWNQTNGVGIAAPYEVGSRLWVRETWTHDAPDLDTCRAAFEDVSGGIGYGPYYRATEVAPDTLKWKPAIFMPRWACRIELEVIGVCVERLQAITEEDARAEGVERDTEPCDHTRLSCEEIGCMGPTYRSTFCELWDSINGDRGGWELNPWVWVVEFRRVEQAL